jgi:arylsulfatase
MLQHTYSMLGVDTYKQRATSKLPTGDVRVRMLFESTEAKPGSGGRVSLFVNDEEVGGGDMPRTVPITFTSYAGMDIGRDNGAVVDLAYEDQAPYAFTGTVKQVVFDLRPATHDEESGLHAHEVHQVIATGVAG